MDFSEILYWGVFYDNLWGDYKHFGHFALDLIVSGVISSL